jgi:hypothetical protein
MHIIVLANFKKISPSTTCLYSDDSTVPRSLLAESHRVSSMLGCFFVLVAFAITSKITKPAEWVNQSWPYDKDNKCCQSPLHAIHVNYIS